MALSPMDGVSDYPFRAINKKYGQMDLVFTEFSNVEGICRSGNSSLLNHFDFDSTQRPLIAQIYGKTPEYFRQVTILLCELGVDGVDINMGCPAPTVAHHGSGAALIKTPQLAQAIVASVQQGVREWANGATMDDCPDLQESIKQTIVAKKKQFGLTDPDRASMPTVSVKTRMGYHHEEAASWLPYLIEMNPTALSLHGRTLKQSYAGFADWEVIGKAAALVKRSNPDIIFLGNGDVADYEAAVGKVREYGVDGVLIGRASFGKPQVFLPEAERATFLTTHNIFAIALEHARLYEETYGMHERYHFMPMRKHLAWYARGVPQAASIRSQLVRSNTALEVEQILRAHQLL